LSVARSEGSSAKLVLSEYISGDIRFLARSDGRRKIEGDVTGSLISNGVVSCKPHNVESLSSGVSSHSSRTSSIIWTSGSVRILIRDR